MKHQCNFLLLASHIHIMNLPFDFPLSFSLPEIIGRQKVENTAAAEMGKEFCTFYICAQMHVFSYLYIT